MKGLDWLQQLLTALGADEHVRRLLGPGESMLDKALEELNDLRTKINPRNYQVYKLKDKDYGSFLVVDGSLRWASPIGTRVSYAKNNLIYNPHGLAWDETTGELWVASYNWGIRRFDDNFSFLGGFSHHLGYVVDVALTDDLVVVADYNNRVICLDRSTGERVWTFGNGTAGDLLSNRVYRPTSVAFAPNGNVLVACAYGKEGSADRPLGTISEHDINDGSLVKVHLKYTQTGQAWNNEVYRPHYVRVYLNPNGDYELWASFYATDYVAVYTWHPVTNVYTYRRIYGRSDHFSLFSMNVSGFVVSSDYRRLYVGVAGPQVVGVLDTVTGDVLGFIGRQGYENYKDAPDTPGLFMDIQGLALINNESELVVADRGNSRIQSFPSSLLEVPAYTLEYEKESGPDALALIDQVTDQRFSLANQSLTLETRDLLVGNYPKKVIVVGKTEC